uniref:Inter-alpha-trypsin inhibitor heavy chain 3 n=1 Tax=Oreochromis aureus TaxID=47969 RepID=A0A668RVA4_OREAU
KDKFDDWDIYSFHINSTVTSRYATTVITSRLFLVLFRFIDGQVYDGVVKAKEQAQQQYTEAVSRGESAGLVSSVGRTLEEFKTSVTVAAHKKVTFELTYEELMKRTHGKYELQIHARPMQPVRDFKVDVHIHEEAGISFIDVKGGLSTKALANAITKTHADKQAWVYFYPTVDQQKMCDSCGDQGMNGDLVIVYDVNRDNGLGHIKKSDGYFVHHFAPSDLPRIPKNVVFVIDQSGSMHGRKIEQTRIALVHILNDLAEDDHFGLITFDDRISYWKRELVQANSKNLESAKNFARNIQDRGSTDINEAVLQGARMLNAHNREGSASILILLTDGDPTSGVTNLENIQSNVRQAIAGKFPLYCLGFGFDVNFNFLEKMSLQNNGVARRIYEDSDADLQLKGFYEEVATPLLTDVTMIYVGGTNLTQTNFSHYYNGSEIVVAGEITDNNIETFTPQVSNRRIIFSNPNETVESTGTVSDDRIQRVWAYLTVKQLLDKELQLSGPEKEKVKKEAMALSLKYSFVTPLTSMVVTKPPGENTDVLHKPKEGETSQRWPSPGGQPNLAHLTPASGYSGQWVLSGEQIKPIQQHSPVQLRRRSLTVQRCSVNERKGVCNRLSQIDVSQTEHFYISPPVFIVVKEQHFSFVLDLSVNGELDSIANGGFSKIFIHLKTHQHVEVDAESQRVTVRDGQTVTYQTAGQDPSTVGSVTVTVYNTEIHIAAENILLVISQHEKNGQRLLWPVLRQQPSTNNTEGLLGEFHQDMSLFFFCSDSAIDYSTDPPVSKNCWLMSADSALQRPLADFFMAQL